MMDPSALRKNHEYAARFEGASTKAEMIAALQRLARTIRYAEGDGTDSELLKVIEQTLGEMDRK